MVCGKLTTPWDPRTTGAGGKKGGGGVRGWGAGGRGMKATDGMMGRRQELGSRE